VELPQPLAAKLQQTNQPIPSPVAGFALIDTGATFSAVDATVVQHLAIHPIGVVNVGGAAGVQQHSVYTARFEFPGINFPAFDHHRLAGVNLQGATLTVAAGGSLIALTGRDILTRFVMVYNGPDGMFTVAH
jgi:predicted aspartyl protease